MIKFIYGPDVYRIKKRIGTLIEDFQKKYYDSDTQIFDLSESSFQNAIDALKNRSLFQEHKLVVIKNLFSQKTSFDTLVQAQANYNLKKDPDIQLVICEAKDRGPLVKQSGDLFKYLISPDIDCEYLLPLTQGQLESWLKDELAKYNCAIDSAAIRKLINLAGSDSWLLSVELEKLSNYKLGGTITVGDIEKLVSSREEMNIFNFIDALANKDRAEALELLYREINSGRDPYYILTMITYQFRNMLLVEDLARQSLPSAAIAKKASIHPFVAQKMSQNIKKFNASELKDIYAKLTALDTDAKLGHINLIDSLYNLVFLWK